MIDIRLALVYGIDGKALIPLSNLILSYVMHHRNIGTVEIYRDRINFCKFFITKDKILFNENNLEYRNNRIYYTGYTQPELMYGQAGILLVNILRQLHSGFISQFEV